MKILTGFSMRQLLNGVNGLEGNTGLIKTKGCQIIKVSTPIMKRDVGRPKVHDTQTRGKSNGFNSVEDSCLILKDGPSYHKG